MVAVAGVVVVRVALDAKLVLWDLKHGGVFGVRAFCKARYLHIPNQGMLLSTQRLVPREACEAQLKASLDHETQHGILRDRESTLITFREFATGLRVLST